MKIKIEYPHPALIGRGCSLRKWRLEDAPCIVEASSDSHITEITSVEADSTIQQANEFIARQWMRHLTGEGLPFAIVSNETGKAAGFITLIPDTETTLRIGYWIAPSGRGQGFTAQAVEMLSEWTIANTDYKRVRADVALNNPASLAVVRKAGFNRDNTQEPFQVTYNGSKSDAGAFVFEVPRTR